jgi:hypothetical protein
MCRITIAHTVRHRISSASLSKRFLTEPFGTYYNLQLLPNDINPSPKKDLDYLGRNSSIFRVPTNSLTSKSDKGPSEKWPSNRVCRMVRDCGWLKSMRAVCGSKIQSVTNETLTSTRLNIGAELRYGTVLSWVQKHTRKPRCTDTINFFLNTMANIGPQMIDSTDENGATTRGPFNVFKPTFGERSFDENN